MNGLGTVGGWNANSEGLSIPANTYVTGSFFVKQISGAGGILGVYFGEGSSTKGGGCNLVVSASGEITVTGSANTSIVVQKFMNGWFRIGVTTNTVGNVSSLMFTFHNPAYTTLAFYGRQFELGKQMTSYIPTTGAAATRAEDVYTSSAATRAADSAIACGLSRNIASSVGTAVVEFDMLARIPAASYPGVYTFENDYFERIGVFVASNLDINAKVIASGVADQYNSITAQSYSPNSRVRHALSWTPGLASASMDGSSVRSIAPPKIPSLLTNLRIGQFDSPLNGHIRSFKYWPTAQADLQSLTS